jgi:hypothetical protein
MAQAASNRIDLAMAAVCGAAFAERSASLAPTPGARVHDLRGSFASFSAMGEHLSGTGALVFEGETLATTH